MKAWDKDKPCTRCGGSPVIDLPWTRRQNRYVCRSCQQEHDRLGHKHRFAENRSVEMEQKLRAKYAVNNAIRSGKITRKLCEVCGEVSVQGHHDDYSKPLMTFFGKDRMETREDVGSSAPLLKSKAAAELLDVCVSYLAALRSDGTGPAFVRVGRRAVRYEIRALKEWMATRKRTSTRDHGGV